MPKLAFPHYSKMLLGGTTDGGAYSLAGTPVAAATTNAANTALPQYTVPAAATTTPTLAAATKPAVSASPPVSDSTTGTTPGLNGTMYTDATGQAHDLVTMGNFFTDASNQQNFPEVYNAYLSYYGLTPATQAQSNAAFSNFSIPVTPQAANTGGTLSTDTGNALTIPTGLGGSSTTPGGQVVGASRITLPNTSYTGSMYRTQSGQWSNLASDQGQYSPTPGHAIAYNYESQGSAGGG